MYIKPYNYVLLLLILNSCTTQGQQHKEGQFIESFQLQNTVTGELGYDLPDTAWFRDSLIIEQILRYNTNTIHNVTTFSTTILQYLFIDLRKGLVYKYKDLSDTATIMEIYPVKDSGRVRRDALKKYFRLESIDYLSVESQGKDTVIDGVWYKRDIIWRQNRQWISKLISLRRCNQQNNLFTLGYFGLPDDDCPITKYFLFSDTSAYPFITAELKYVADTLTAEQRKIFDTWERYADSHAEVPVLPYISPRPGKVKTVYRKVKD